jgi:hypothetical protein
VEIMCNRALVWWVLLTGYTAVVQSKGGGGGGGGGGGTPGGGTGNGGDSSGDRADSVAEPASDAPMIIAIVVSVLFSVVVTVCICRHIARRRSHRAYVDRRFVEPSRAHVVESRVCRWFQNCDVDGSGKIDVKELKARP